MKILIACEYSGIVRDAFLAKGHDVMSCDILPTESPGPHYQGSVFDIINNGWDMMIAHPPCTYLTYAANRVKDQPGRAAKRIEALKFFNDLLDSGIPKIAIENPLGWAINIIGQPDQIVYPYYFGEPQVKRIALWLKNLPKLRHSPADDLFTNHTHAQKPPPIQLIVKDDQHTTYIVFVVQKQGQNFSRAWLLQWQINGVDVNHHYIPPGTKMSGFFHFVPK